MAERGKILPAKVGEFNKQTCFGNINKRNHSKTFPTELTENVQSPNVTA